MLSETGTHPVREYAARSAAGRPAKTISGLARADMDGIPSTRAACVQRAFTTGLRPSACRAADGRHTHIGMCSNESSSPEHIKIFVLSK
jgi:hypothetical protein